MKIAMLVPDNRDEFRRYTDPEPYFGTAPTALLEGLAQMPGEEVHIVSCTQRKLRAPARIASNIFYHSIIVPKWGWLRGGYLGCIWAVRKKLREINPDIVHGQGTERYCALSAVRSGFPNVLTLHGNMRLIAKNNHARPFSFLWLAARLERITLPQCGGVICISAYMQREVAPLVPATWIVPNAVRGIFFAAARPIALESPPILLNIGVIGERKRQNEILQAVSRLRGRVPAFQLHFIGQLDRQSAYGARFLKGIEEAQSSGQVKYLGTKSGDELIDLMDRAVALVHFPSEESFGLVVAEGLARNLKLFGAKVGGIVDIAKGVEGAELFDADDWRPLEDAMARWLAGGHPKLTQAAERMRERYHPASIARRHLEIYREVARNHA